MQYIQKLYKLSFLNILFIRNMFISTLNYSLVYLKELELHMRDLRKKHKNKHFSIRVPKVWKMQFWTKNINSRKVFHC